MTIAGLEFIGKELLGLGINYEFGRWNSEPVYPYFVGNTSEVTKDDYPKETAFILEGFTRGSKLELLQVKEVIEEYFKNGVTAILENGSGVAVVYDDANCDIPTGDASLKKIQVNLTVKEWKVN